jgi:hypothetical protein
MACRIRSSLADFGIAFQIRLNHGSGQRHFGAI